MQLVALILYFILISYKQNLYFYLQHFLISLLSPVSTVIQWQDPNWSHIITHNWSTVIEVSYIKQKIYFKAPVKKKLAKLCRGPKAPIELNVPVSHRHLHWGHCDAFPRHITSQLEASLRWVLTQFEARPQPP